MNRVTNEQREAIVREAVAKRDALLAEKPDCAGGSPCTTCPDKRQCAKTGCIWQPEFISAAAQGGQQPVAEVRLTLGMPIIEWVGRDYPVGTKLYTGPTAAPLTEARVIEIARATESAEPGRDGYILPITFARAILAEVGITLAGTAQKGGEDGR